MKHIKSFENIKGKNPEVGDYVILNVDRTEPTKPNFIHFIDTHVGEVLEVNYRASLAYLIEFDDIVPYNGPTEPENKNYLRFDKDEIIDFSKSKEELELKIQTKKYNI